jgi:error-prone DNA polymerase
VLLAQTRAGYGNLSQLVSLARRQAPKGSYRLAMADLQAHAHWLDHTLALLIPPPQTRTPAHRPARAPAQAAGAAEKCVPDPDFLFVEQARWLAAQMPGRCWIACALLRAGDDAAAFEVDQTAQVAACGVLLAGRRGRGRAVMLACRTLTLAATAMTMLISAV